MDSNRSSHDAPDTVDSTPQHDISQAVQKGAAKPVRVKFETSKSNCSQRSSHNSGAKFIYRTPTGSQASVKTKRSRSFVLRPNPFYSDQDSYRSYSKNYTSDMSDPSDDGHYMPRVCSKCVSSCRPAVQPQCRNTSIHPGAGEQGNYCACAYCAPAYPPHKNCQYPPYIPNQEPQENNPYNEPYHPFSCQSCVQPASPPRNCPHTLPYNPVYGAPCKACDDPSPSKRLYKGPVRSTNCLSNYDRTSSEARKNYHNPSTCEKKLVTPEDIGYGKVNKQSCYTENHFGKPKQVADDGNLYGKTRECARRTENYPCQCNRGRYNDSSSCITDGNYSGSGYYSCASADHCGGHDRKRQQVGESCFNRGGNIRGVNRRNSVTSQCRSGNVRPEPYSSRDQPHQPSHQRVQYPPSQYQTDTLGHLGSKDQRGCLKRPCDTSVSEEHSQSCCFGTGVHKPEVSKKLQTLHCRSYSKRTKQSRANTNENIESQTSVSEERESSNNDEINKSN